MALLGGPECSPVGPRSGVLASWLADPSRRGVRRRDDVLRGVALAAAVAVVSNPGAGCLWAQSGVAVDPRPAVVIRGSSPSGDLRVSRPTGATRLANGDIVIADGTGPAIWFFDAEGRPLRSVGRSGRGPGEFGIISWLRQCGPDSVFAYDLTLQRLSVLGRDGRIVRQLRMPVVPSILACSPGGVLAVLPRYRVDSPPAGPPRRVRVPLSLVNSQGRVLRTIGGVQSLEVAWVNAWLPRPLGRRTSLALFGDRLYVGTGDSAAIEVFGLDGRRLPTIVLRLPSRSPQRRHLERAIEATSVFLATPLHRRLLRDALMGIPVPDRLPPYSAILADPIGTLWVVTSFPGDSVTRLLEFDSRGQPLGEALIPVELSVFEIGRDYVLGAYEDSEGEPAVALYRLRRGR